MQWQMFVTGAPWCDVAVLLGGLVFRIERVTASIDYQTELYRKAVEFRNALATQTPPALQGQDSDALILLGAKAISSFNDGTDESSVCDRLYPDIRDST